MAKSFGSLLEKMSPERRERVEEHAQRMLLDMALQEIRQNRHVTQQQLADSLKLNQAALLEMENQSDMHVSTLGSIVAAMGGKLKLIAQFPDAEIIINQ